MSLDYWIGGLYGVVLLAAFAGWGAMAERMLRLAQPAPIAVRASRGIAVLLALGGILNLFQVISGPLCAGLVGAGVLALLLDTFDRRREMQWPRLPAAAGLTWAPRLLAVVIVAATAIRVASVVSSTFHPGPLSAGVLNVHDDGQAYLVFPHKMLETGSLGADPFSGRRLTSGYQGIAFLQTFVMLTGHDRHIHLIDPAIALLITLAIVAVFCRARGVGALVSLTLLAFVALIPAPVDNVTSLLTSLGMFLVLAWDLSTWARRQDAPWKRGVLVGVLCAGIIALKASLIAAVGLWALLGYLVLLQAAPVRSAILVEAGVAAVVSLGLTAPWALSLRQSSGTLLFPLLGRSYAASFPMPFDLVRPADAPWLAQVFLSNPFVPALLILLIAAFFNRRRADSDDRLAPAWIAASLVAAALTTVIMRGEENTRLVWPFGMAAVLVGGMLLGALPAAGRIRRAGLLLALLVVLVGTARDSARRFHAALHDVRVALASQDLTKRSDRDRHLRLQSAVPEGQKLLARLARPFLLDFRRNPILLIDWPGESSPPPGMPLDRGPDALAGYLLNQGVRYVGWDYADEAGYSRRSFGRRLELPLVYAREHARQTFAFQDLLEQLRSSRLALYDDGLTVVMDLARATGPATGPAAR